jgi:cytoskeletal protein CcmA (bactofilin family)
MNQTDNCKAPVFIGPDVIVEGTIRRKDGGDPNEVANITGVFKGNIDWPGIVQVAPGAEVVIESKVSCREIEVAGKISGSDQNVVLETGMLRMRESAIVDVGLLSLPPGGLEQARGAVVNANLRMTKEYPYASQQPLPLQSRPLLAVVSNEAPAADKEVPAFLTVGAQGAGTMQPGAGQALPLATGTGQR